MKKFWHDVIEELDVFGDALLKDIKVISNELPYSSGELKQAGFPVLSCAKTLDERKKGDKLTYLEQCVRDVKYVSHYINEILLYSKYSFVDGWKLPTSQIWDLDCIQMSPLFVHLFATQYLLSSNYSIYPKPELTLASLEIFYREPEWSFLKKLAPVEQTYSIDDVIRVFNYSELQSLDFAIVINDVNHFMWNAINIARGTYWTPEKAILESWSLLHLHNPYGIPKLITPKRNIEHLMQKLNTIK